MSLRSSSLVRRGSRWAALALVLALAAGCGSSMPEAAAPPQPMHAAGAGMEVAAAAEAPAAPSPSPAPQPAHDAGKGPAGKSAAPAPSSAENAKSATSAKVKAQALVVYKGHVQLAVDHDGVAVTIDAVIDAAETLGGHLAGRTNDQVQIKVPSASFRDALQAVAKLGDVQQSNVTAEDVTAEFHDLEVRLENPKATRKRLEEFLAKAHTIADMLTVERELERVAKEMDTISGRLRFLREHTAFSVLTVKVAAKPKPAPPVVAQNPPPPSPAPPPPPPRAIDLPVSWFGSLGVPTLLDVRNPKN